jgi:hypothetical protein
MAFFSIPDFASRNSMVKPQRNHQIYGGAFEPFQRAVASVSSGHELSSHADVINHHKKRLHTAAFPVLSGKVFPNMNSHGHVAI